MKTTIPDFHIDELSYGPVDYFVDRFMGWLRFQKNRGVKLIVIPAPRDDKERFNIAMAELRPLVRNAGMTVISEERLAKAKIVKKLAEVKQPSKLPSPFDCLVVEDGWLRVA